MARLIVLSLYALCTWSLATSKHTCTYTYSQKKQATRVRDIIAATPAGRSSPAVQSNHHPARRVTSRTAASRSRAAQVARRPLLHLSSTTTTHRVWYDSLGPPPSHRHYSPGELQTLPPRLRVRLTSYSTPRSKLSGRGLTANPRHHTINMI